MRNKNKIVCLIFIVVMIIAYACTQRASDTDIDLTLPTDGGLDDFDDGFNPNLWGGNYSSHQYTYGCYDSANNIDSSFGYAYKIKYVLPENQWGGISVRFNTGEMVRNLSAFEHLYFWIKADSNGHGIKLELKDEFFNSSNLYLANYIDGTCVSTDWTEVKIPLDAFCDHVSKDRMIELNFIFDYSHAYENGLNTSGTVYLENIGFSETSLDYLRIEHFNDVSETNALAGSSGSFGTGFSSSYSDTTYDGYPNSLVCNYDVTGSGSQGYWMVFGSSQSDYKDFSLYNKITFSVRGDATADIPDAFKIELLNGDSHYPKATIPDDATPSTPISATAWTTYTVDFNDLTEDVFMSTEVQKFAILFENTYVGANTTGKIYIDNIQFEK